MSSRPPSPSVRPSGPNPAIIVGVVIAVLVVAAAAVFLTAGGGDDERVDADATSEGGEVVAEFGAVSIDGDALPAAADGEDPAIGMAAPAMESERSDAQVGVEPGDGEPMMLVFLAHWCPHCQDELPLLVQMQESGAFDGIRTVAVLTGTDASADNYPPSAWLDRQGWEGDRFFDDEEQSAARTYGLSSYPMIVFVDADGTVVRRTTGEQPEEVVQAGVDAARGTAAAS